MTQQATQQKVRERKGDPDAGPATPVLITGGGTFPVDEPLPSKLHIGPTEGGAPLVFEIVAPGAEGTEQWVQSRSASVGTIESVVVDDYPPFEVAKHPITISILGAAMNPLLTITEMRESEDDAYRMFISSNDPCQPFTAEGQNISGEGWTESESDALDALGYIYVGGEHASLTSMSTIQVNFVGPV